MLRRVLVLGVCMFALQPAMHSAKAASIPMEKVSYVIDFEEKDPVVFWTGNKDYVVNFKGLTDEKCTGGKKCFKMDLTFKSKGYVYWRIPMPSRIPAEGTLKFTGNVFLGGDTTVGVGIGPSYSYYPSTVGGTCNSMYDAKVMEKWLPAEGDLVEVAKNIKLNEWTWGSPEVSNAGRYLTDMLIRLYIRENTNAVIYLDDWKVEGEVPVAADYAREIDARWAPIKAKLDAKVSEWETALDQNAKDIEIITTSTDAAAQTKKAALDKITALRTQIKNIKARGAMNIVDEQQIEKSIKALIETKGTLKA